MWCAALAFLLNCGTAAAVETKIIVRALAKDAKFIGTSMDGSEVVIRDAETGKVLAEGITAGGTGNTKKLVTGSKTRGQALSDGRAAKFETAIDIDEPKLLTIEVSAPLSHPRATVKATTQVWLIPGKHIVGDGVIVEIPGFVVDMLSPENESSLRLEGGVARIPLRLRMVMM